ncbi:hypothetical protein [Gluconobacter sp. GP1]|uniref:hypothetical protein n=1 Tax=Gluconobacter sp. GP1 TaxID=3046423 RepID=UPI00293F27C8|nr:hypothetical protein [Gluconobacter sp. GP1]
MSLYDAFTSVKSGEIEKNVHFFSIYERYLASYRHRPCILFLIIDEPHAQAQAKMWARYLGAFSKIICLTDGNRDEGQIAFRNGNLDDSTFKKQLIIEFGAPDIVIDDGSHLPEETISGFENLNSIVKNNGLYFIEDTYTSYWDNYKGSLGEPRTILGYTKDLIDEIHAHHTGQEIPPNAFSENVQSIHIYDGLLVFEYGQYLDRRSIKNF